MTDKSWLASLVLAAICWNANAQGVDFPPGEDRIVPVEEGERAPFAGQLFESNTAVRWGFRLQRLRLQLDQDVAREREICTAQNDLLTTKMQLARESQEFQLTILRDQLQFERNASSQLAERLSSLEDPSWYQTWAFGMVVGLASAALLMGLSGYLVYEFA